MGHLCQKVKLRIFINIAWVKCLLEAPFKIMAVAKNVYVAQMYSNSFHFLIVFQDGKCFLIEQCHVLKCSCQRMRFTPENIIFFKVWCNRAGSTNGIEGQIMIQARLVKRQDLSNFFRWNLVKLVLYLLAKCCLPWIIWLRQCILDTSSSTSPPHTPLGTKGQNLSWLSWLDFM